MTEDEATEIVYSAFCVIIDGVLGENSHPEESYQNKYKKVERVDQEVVDTLDREFEITSNIRYAITSRIATNIIRFNENNPGSFLSSNIKPERWMFASI